MGALSAGFLLLDLDLPQVNVVIVANRVILRQAQLLAKVAEDMLCLYPAAIRFMPA